MLAANVAFSAGWEAVQRIPPDAKITVRSRAMPNEVHGTFVSATETTLVVRAKAGEQAVSRNDIRRVKVADPGRRTRNGLIATGIGAAVGIAIGAAVCPHCANEGSGGKYMGPLGAAGAGVGALGFLPTPYRTIYKVD
jgi:hypothetical protein